MCADLSNNMAQLRSSADSKASAFLGAAAIAVSLLTVSVTLLEEDIFVFTKYFLKIDLVGSFTAVMFIFGTISFVLAGVSALKGISLQRWHLPQYCDVLKLLNDAKGKKDWFAMKLVYNEINEYVYMTKSNWAFSAYQHFLYALIYVAMGFGGLLLGSQLGQVYIAKSRCIK